MLAISSPLTSKTAESFGVTYEPTAQPMRLPEDLQRAKAEHDLRIQQRKTMAATGGSAVASEPLGASGMIAVRTAYLSLSLSLSLSPQAES